MRLLGSALTSALFLASVLSGQEPIKKSVVWKSVTTPSIKLKIPDSQLKHRKPSSDLERETYSARIGNTFYWITLSSDFDDSPIPYLLSTTESADADCDGQKSNSKSLVVCSFVESGVVAHKFLIMLVQSRLVTLYMAGIEPDKEIADKFFKYTLSERLIEEDSTTFERDKIMDNMFPGKTIPKQASGNAGFFSYPVSLRLSVEFRANGTIGTTKLVSFGESGLAPYSLIQRAFDAAGKIKFQPGLRNGNAVPVIKTVVYNFSIF